MRNINSGFFMRRLAAIFFELKTVNKFITKPSKDKTFKTQIGRPSIKISFSKNHAGLQQFHILIKIFE